MEVPVSDKSAMKAQWPWAEAVAALAGLVVMLLAAAIPTVPNGFSELLVYAGGFAFLWFGVRASVGFMAAARGEDRPSRRQLVLAGFGALVVGMLIALCATLLVQSGDTRDNLAIRGWTLGFIAAVYFFGRAAWERFPTHRGLAVAGVVVVALVAGAAVLGAATYFQDNGATSHSNPDAAAVAVRACNVSDDPHFEVSNQGGAVEMTLLATDGSVAADWDDIDCVLAALNATDQDRAEMKEYRDRFAADDGGQLFGYHEWHWSDLFAVWDWGDGQRPSTLVAVRNDSVGLP